MPADQDVIEDHRAFIMINGVGRIPANTIKEALGGLMLGLELSEVQHWINVYGVIFSLLILSLSINLTFFIKDKINRILAILVCTAIITRIINRVFAISYVGLMEQDPLLTFIFKGTDKNIFAGMVPFLVAVLALIVLIVRLFWMYQRKNKMESFPSD